MVDLNHQEPEEVFVEVWVTDANGKAVRGLGRDAFTVLHDGAPVAITHFSEISQGVPQTNPAIEPTAASAGSIGTPHLVVVFDLFRLTQRSQKRIVRDLRSFLASGEIPAEVSGEVDAAKS